MSKNIKVLRFMIAYALSFSLMTSYINAAEASSSPLGELVSSPSEELSKDSDGMKSLLYSSYSNHSSSLSYHLSNVLSLFSLSDSKLMALSSLMYISDSSSIDGKTSELFSRYLIEGENVKTNVHSTESEEDHLIHTVSELKVRLLEILDEDSKEYDSYELQDKVWMILLNSLHQYKKLTQKDFFSVLFKKETSSIQDFLKDNSLPLRSMDALSQMNRGRNFSSSLFNFIEFVTLVSAENNICLFDFEIIPSLILAKKKFSCDEDMIQRIDRVLQTLVVLT